MPLSGEIIEVNDRLTSEPEVVNLDCYNEGWILRLKLDNPSELDATLSSADYLKVVVE